MIEKTNLLIIRHAQSTTNNEKIFTGQIDAKLSDIGKEQAKLLEKYVCANYKISAVYSSDLIRAENTVKNIAKDFNIPFVLTKNLREINAGLWQGKTMQQIENLYPQQCSIWHTDLFDCYPDGGESVKEAIERVVNEVLKIARNNIGKTVIVCTHGLAIRGLAYFSNKQTTVGINKTKFTSNATISRFVFENNKLSLIEYDKNDFLGELATGMPERF